MNRHMYLHSLLCIMALQAYAIHPHSDYDVTGTHGPSILDGLDATRAAFDLAGLIGIGKNVRELKQLDTLAQEAKANPADLKPVRERQAQIIKKIRRWQQMSALLSGLAATSRDALDDGNTREKTGRFEHATAGLSHLSRAADLMRTAPSTKHLAPRAILALITLAAALTRNRYTRHESNTPLRTLLSLIHKFAPLIQYHLARGTAEKTGLSRLAYAAQIGNLALSVDKLAPWTAQENAEQSTLRAHDLAQQALATIGNQFDTEEALQKAYETVNKHATATHSFATTANTDSARAKAKAIADLLQASQQPGYEALTEKTAAKAEKTAKRVTELAPCGITPKASDAENVRKLEHLASQADTFATKADSDKARAAAQRAHAALASAKQTVAELAQSLAEFTKEQAAQKAADIATIQAAHDSFASTLTAAKAALAADNKEEFDRIANEIDTLPYRFGDEAAEKLRDEMTHQMGMLRAGSKSVAQSLAELGTEDRPDSDLRMLRHYTNEGAAATALLEAAGKRIKEKFDQRMQQTITDIEKAKPEERLPSGLGGGFGGWDSDLLGRVSAADFRAQPDKTIQAKRQALEAARDTVRILPTDLFSEADKQAYLAQLTERENALKKEEIADKALCTAENQASAFVSGRADLATRLQKAQDALAQVEAATAGDTLSEQATARLDKIKGCVRQLEAEKQSFDEATPVREAREELTKSYTALPLLCRNFRPNAPSEGIQKACTDLRRLITQINTQAQAVQDAAAPLPKENNTIRDEHRNAVERAGRFIETQLSELRRVLERNAKDADWHAVKNAYDAVVRLDERTRCTTSADYRTKERNIDTHIKNVQSIVDKFSTIITQLPELAGAKPAADDHYTTSIHMYHGNFERQLAGMREKKEAAEKNAKKLEDDAARETAKAVDKPLRPAATQFLMQAFQPFAPDLKSAATIKAAYKAFKKANKVKKDEPIIKILKQLYRHLTTGQLVPADIEEARKILVGDWLSSIEKPASA